MQNFKTSNDTIIWMRIPVYKNESHSKDKSLFQLQNFTSTMKKLTDKMHKQIQQCWNKKKNGCNNKFNKESIVKHMTTNVYVQENNESA